MTRLKQEQFFLFPLMAVTLLFLWQAEAVGDGVRAGLGLCYRSIIPSVFPFSVLSAYMASWAPNGRRGLLGRAFEGVFRLPASGLLPLFIGLFCGFPLGAKGVADGYRRGLYSREEAERLLCFTNNTGLSFLIAGVGVSMRGEVKDGIALAVIQLLSALLCGLFVRGDTVPKGKQLPSKDAGRVRFPQAVSSALTGTLNICAFVLFFSCILEITSLFLPTEIQAVLACFLEVGSACSLLASQKGGLILTAFAICFSGLSVHMQTAYLLLDTDLSMSRYWAVKVLNGAIAVGLCALYVTVFP